MKEITARGALSRMARRRTRSSLASLRTEARDVARPSGRCRTAGCRSKNGGSDPSKVSNVTSHPRAAQWLAIRDRTRSAPPQDSDQMTSVNRIARRAAGLPAGPEAS